MVGFIFVLSAAYVAKANNEETTKSNSNESEGQSNLYLYLGLALAVILVLVIIGLVMYVFRSRKRRNSRKEISERIGLSYGNDATALVREREPNHYRNIPRTPSKFQEKVEPVESKASLLAESTPDDQMEMRSVRLSQLADKYIDVNISTTISQSFAVSTKLNEIEEEYNQDLIRGSESPGTFNRKRAQYPAPVLTYTHDDATCCTGYEPVDTMPHEKNFKPIAYLEGKTKIVITSETDQDFNETNPDQDRSRKNSLNVAPMQIMVSMDALDGPDQSKSANVSPSHTKVRRISRYFSSSQDLYVSPNNASNESLQNHFIKPVPNPGVSISTTSMPDLNASPARKSSGKATIQKPKRRSKSPLAANISQPDSRRASQISSQNSPMNYQHYKYPRPSAPEILVHSAYSTEQDLKQIRLRLEKVAAQPSSAYSDKTSIQPPKGAVLYDSPRPSPTGSTTSVSEIARATFYDTPRPSTRGEQTPAHLRHFDDDCESDTAC